MNEFFKQLLCWHDYVVFREPKRADGPIYPHYGRHIAVTFDGVLLKRIPNETLHWEDAEKKRVRCVNRQLDKITDKVCSKCLKTKLRLKRMKLATLAREEAVAIARGKATEKKAGLQLRRTNAKIWGVKYIDLADKA